MERVARMDRQLEENKNIIFLPHFHFHFTNRVSSSLSGFLLDIPVFEFFLARSFSFRIRCCITGGSEKIKCVEFQGMLRGQRGYEETRRIKRKTNTIFFFSHSHSTKKLDFRFPFVHFTSARWREMEHNSSASFRLSEKFMFLSLWKIQLNLHFIRILSYHRMRICHSFTGSRLWVWVNLL